MIRGSIFKSIAVNKNTFVSWLYLWTNLFKIICMSCVLRKYVYQDLFSLVRWIKNILERSRLSIPLGSFKSIRELFSRFKHFNYLRRTLCKVTAQVGHPKFYQETQHSNTVLSEWTFPPDQRGLITNTGNYHSLTAREPQIIHHASRLLDTLPDSCVAQHSLITDSTAKP